MLIIDSTAAMAVALDQPLDPALRRLLTTRRDQLAGAGELGDAARFLVVEPRDTLADVEAELGFPIVSGVEEGVCLDAPDAVPCWEWAEHHDGGCLEATFLFSDDGAADVLLVCTGQGIDPDLIALLRHHAPHGHEHLGA